MDYSKWRLLIGQHLGVKFAKKISRDLTLDLRAVDIGLKPALLLDFAVGSVDSLTTLLHALTTADLLTNQLTVVTIEMDILIVNPASFKESLDVGFVDVSGNLEHPHPLAGSCVPIQSTKISFVKICEHVVCSTSRTVEVSVGGGDDQDGVNPSTLFGLFLGYPVVYYYDVGLDSPHNCLGLVPLVNFVLKATVNDTTEGRQCVNSNHVVSSFSVPEALVSEMESRVEDWFKERKDCVRESKLFGKLDLERRTVQLPSVCL